MRRVIAVVVLGLALAGADPAAAGGLTGRVGAFFPRADSTLFDDTAVLYDTEASDFIGFTGGAEWSFDLGRRVELGLHVDGYSETEHTSYRDFTYPNRREIQQSLQSSSWPVGGTLYLLATDRKAAVVPYVGVGADAVFWEYEEWGEFIDFDSRDLDVYEDSFQSDGVAFGLHAALGARFRVSDDVNITAEGRYLFSNAEMGDDFRGSEIDLGGLAVTVGVQLRLD